MDKDRLNVAERATQAIENGEPFAVTEDGYYKVYTPILFSEATNPWSVAVSVPMSEVMQKSSDMFESNAVHKEELYVTMGKLPKWFWLFRQKLSKYDASADI